MTFRKKPLARTAAAAALKLRRHLGIKLQHPISVFDIAEQMGIKVWFIDIPSLDAMYARNPQPLILLSSGRPLARQVYSCAHELAHHHFSHGDRLEHFLPNLPANDPEEFLAESFAGMLLMPPLALRHAFSCRGWKVDNPSREQLYVISANFGVGYSTLIYHMKGGLGILPNRIADERLKHQPAKIREAILGEPCRGNLIVVDGQWAGRPVDIQTGDVIISPPNATSSGECVEYVKDFNGKKVFQAKKKGCGRLTDNSEKWAIFVRVSEREFVGRGIYRHLEEPDND